MKLPKTQQELLDAIRGGAVVNFSPYWLNTPAYFWMSGVQYKKVTTAARALLKAGLVEKYDKTIRGSYKLRIKPLPPPPEQNK